MPVAKYITLSRIASPYSVDKRYEEQFTAGVRAHFEQGGAGSDACRMIKRGDVISVPVYGIAEEESESFEWAEDKDEAKRYVAALKAQRRPLITAFASL